MPDEKWDYAEIVDKFAEEQGLNFSPEVKNILMNAAVEASETGFQYIRLRPAHIFVGTLRGKKGSESEAGIFMEARREAYAQAGIKNAETKSIIDEFSFTESAVITLLKMADDDRVTGGVGQIKLEHMLRVINSERQNPHGLFISTP